MAHGWREGTSSPALTPTPEDVGWEAGGGGGWGEVGGGLRPGCDILPL